MRRNEDRHARAERKLREMRARFVAISRRADRRAFFRRYTIWLAIACVVFVATLWGIQSLLPILSFYIQDMAATHGWSI